MAAKPEPEPQRRPTAGSRLILFLILIGWMVSMSACATHQKNNARPQEMIEWLEEAKWSHEKMLSKIQGYPIPLKAQQQWELTWIDRYKTIIDYLKKIDEKNESVPQNKETKGQLIIINAPSPIF